VERDRPVSNPTVRLRRWTDADFPILVESNSEDMTRYLGGPETDAQLARRHERYLRGWDVGMPRMFAIVDALGQALGGIGWWDTEWNGQPAYETGWSVLPHAQGRGVAKAALALVVEDVRGHGLNIPNTESIRPLVAFPNAANAASNAVCRSAGFELVGTDQSEFRGMMSTWNVWVLASESLRPAGH
jgi:RimJ/RimL family protein N-acetyltransferase